MLKVVVTTDGFLMFDYPDVKDASPQSAFDAAKLLHPDWTDITITVSRVKKTQEKHK